MARDVNDNKPQHVIDQVVEATAKHKSPKIACLGLAFKPDIDDLRGSPSVEIVIKLRDLNVGTLYVAEPYISELPTELRGPNIALMSSREAIKRANIVVLLVNHKEFKEIVIGALAEKTIIDPCGIWYANKNS